MLNRKLISKLVKATGIKQGDFVLLQLWGEDDARGMLHDFSCEIAALGAASMELQHSRLHYKNLFQAMEENCFGEGYFSIFDKANVVIDIFDYMAGKPHPEFPMEKINLYKQYIGGLFNALAAKEKFIQIRVPSEENALESNLSFEDYKTHMLAAYDIDYKELKKEAEELVSSMKGKTTATMLTGSDCKLTLSIENRPWIVDAGDGDLPCGEVYIAPIETSAKGSVLLEKLFFEGAWLENVTLHFEGGELVNSSSDILNEFLHTLPQNFKILCELGIGINENVTELTGCTVLDEKAKGTIHIAIGANVMFGGSNQCNFHMDFVFKGSLTFA